MVKTFKDLVDRLTNMCVTNLLLKTSLKQHKTFDDANFLFQGKNKTYYIICLLPLNIYG